MRILQLSLCSLTLIWLGVTSQSVGDYVVFEGDVLCSNFSNNYKNVEDSSKNLNWFKPWRVIEKAVYEVTKLQAYASSLISVNMRHYVNTTVCTKFRFIFNSSELLRYFPRLFEPGANSSLKSELNKKIGEMGRNDAVFEFKEPYTRSEEIVYDVVGLIRLRTGRQEDLLNSSSGTFEYGVSLARESLSGIFWEDNFFETVKRISNVGFERVHFPSHDFVVARAFLHLNYLRIRSIWGFDSEREIEIKLNNRANEVVEGQKKSGFSKIHLKTIEGVSCSSSNDQTTCKKLIQGQRYRFLGIFVPRRDRLRRKPLRRRS